jgi:hypothetical protein
MGIYDISSRDFLPDKLLEKCKKTEIHMQSQIVYRSLIRIHKYRMKYRQEEVMWGRILNLEGNAFSEITP